LSPSLFVAGAGPGLGAALATRFADGGWDIGLIARLRDVLDGSLADLRGRDVNVSGAVADVTDVAALDRAFDELADAVGTPSVMIYNASLFQPQTALELTPDDLRRSLEVHVVGALNASHSAVRLMRPAGRGILVFTINCLALHPEAASTSLSIGKGAQLNLALSLESDFEETGIKVAVVMITAPIRPGTAFDPEAIAEVYWTLSNQPPDHFERDHTFDGTA
jgi:NAD(P)-dependent dehydrogenase (short-subunit alcohol dehydrogenase family)